MGALVESLFLGEPLPKSRTIEVRRLGEAHEATLDTSLLERAIEDGCVLDQVAIGIEYGVGSDARISASVLSELMAKIWPG
ncbi:MAG: hypothetical protein QMC74_05955 [Myxococcota bacterium]|jgi:hypothetical protein